MSQFTFLVTGASSGLGLQISLQALKAGHKVIGTARNVEKATQDQPEFERLGGVWQKLDVTDPNTHSIVDNVVRSKGVNVLINNAGYGLLGSLEDTSEAEFQAQMDTNTTGTFRCIKGALPYFRSLQSTGGATIVNITTMVAIAPYPATAAYAASKCAVEGLSDALAQEVGAFGVRVIIAAPGITRTNFLRDFIKPAAGLNEAYVGGSVDATVSALAGLSGKQPGDPERAGRQIINIVDGTENGKEFQGKGIGEVLRIALGSDCFDTCTAKLASLSEAFKLTEKVARSGDFDSQ